MRNGQNKRMRGRNRKSHNPMTRVFESNGPDVKIRGTPSHIAEKYLQLARDAQSSGDPVSAENYYQHAEHYFRLIAAAQEQFRQSNPQFYRSEMPRCATRLRRRRRHDGPQGARRGRGRRSARASRSPTCRAMRSLIRPREQPITRYAPRPSHSAALHRRRGRCRPAAVLHHRRTSRRSRLRAIRVADKTVMKTRAIVSRCTGAGAGIAARATMLPGAQPVAAAMARRRAASRDEVIGQPPGDGARAGSRAGTSRWRSRRAGMAR